MRSAAARRAGRRRWSTTPSRSCTTATTSLPHRSLGRPATTQSYTAGLAFSAASTSSAKIFSPPELIVTESRPCSSIDPVGAQPGPVARHRVAHPVDHRVGARRLGRVAEVAERQPTALGQPAELGVAGVEQPVEVGGQHVVARAGGERAGGRPAADRHVRQLPAGLRRAEPVDDHQRRQVGEQPFLEVRAQRCSAGQQHGQRRQVVVVPVELVEQRTGERVADDQQEVDPLALDQAPDVGGVEPLRDRLDQARCRRCSTCGSSPSGRRRA